MELSTLFVHSTLTTEKNKLIHLTKYIVSNSALISNYTSKLLAAMMILIPRKYVTGILVLFSKEAHITELDLHAHVLYILPSVNYTDAVRLLSWVKIFIT